MMKTPKSINFVSLAVAAVALTVVFLFFLPWIDDEASEGERVLAGIEVAAQSTLITEEEFPSGVLFITPLVAGGLFWQYYRKVRSPHRPRRRATMTLMLGIGVVAFGLWTQTFAQAASDCFRAGECAALTPEQATYTADDIIRELYDVNVWIYLVLSLVLLVLPWWDKRPEEPKKS